MTQRLSLVSLSILSVCLLLQGCSSVKKTLGIEREAPDEFAVTPSEQPLDMPPDFFALPEPCPGAPRPQDVKAKQEKHAQTFGSNVEHGATSDAQKALLEMAGAEAGQDAVRREIDTESRIQDAKGKPVLESLGIRKPSQGDVINPHEEAARLEEEGLRPASQQGRDAS